MMSASAMAPTTWPSIRSEDHRLALLGDRAYARILDADLPRSREIAGADDLHLASLDHGFRALAGDGAEVLRRGVSKATLRCGRARSRARSGCSDWLSSAGRQAQHLAPPAVGRAATTSVTPNRPSVSVPVLSKTTGLELARRARRRHGRGSAGRCRRRAPCDTATTSGTASPSACGQAITITVTMRSIAKAKPSGRGGARQRVSRRQRRER